MNVEYGEYESLATLVICMGYHTGNIGRMHVTIGVMILFDHNMSIGVNNRLCL